MQVGIEIGSGDEIKDHPNVCFVFEVRMKLRDSFYILQPLAGFYLCLNPLLDLRFRDPL